MSLKDRAIEFLAGHQRALVPFKVRQEITEQVCYAAEKGCYATVITEPQYESWRLLDDLDPQFHERLLTWLRIEGLTVHELGCSTLEIRWFSRV